MQAISVKELINKYPFAALIVSFIIVLISINQIINLAKPSLPKYTAGDDEYNSNYSVVETIAYKPNVKYQGFKSELSAKFPEQPDMAVKYNVNPEISKLPESEQANAIRLSLLESKIEHLQFEISKITESMSEPLIYRLAFYFWGIIIWACSIVIGRILEHLTDQFNVKYLPVNEK